MNINKSTLAYMVLEYGNPILVVSKPDKDGKKSNMLLTKLKRTIEKNINTDTIDPLVVTKIKDLSTVQMDYIEWYATENRGYLTIDENTQPTEKQLLIHKLQDDMEYKQKMVRDIQDIIRNGNPNTRERNALENTKETIKKSEMQLFRMIMAEMKKAN